MSKESIINEMEKIIKERKEREESEKGPIPTDIPDEFVRVIHVAAMSINDVSVAIQLEKAMNNAISEEPMYNVKSITTIHSDALSATVAILFERKF